MEKVKPGPFYEAGINRRFGSSMENEVVLTFFGDGTDGFQLALDPAEAEIIGELLTGLAQIARDLKVTQTRVGS